MKQHESARAIYERSCEAAYEARSLEMKRWFAALRRWIVGPKVMEELMRPSQPSGFRLSIA